MSLFYSRVSSHAEIQVFEPTALNISREHALACLKHAKSGAACSVDWRVCIRILASCRHKKSEATPTKFSGSLALPPMTRTSSEGSIGQGGHDTGQARIGTDRCIGTYMHGVVLSGMFGLFLEASWGSCVRLGEYTNEMDIHISVSYRTALTKHGPLSSHSV